MKKLSILALAAVGLLVGACSSDKDVASVEGNPLQDKGVGYFKVNLNLPYQPSTRAWGEETDLQSGELTSEWAVDNALLILFGGDDEEHAKVVQVSQLATATTGVNVEPVDQVTVKHEEVVTLSATAAAQTNLYALAVVNSTGIIDANGTTSLLINGAEPQEAEITLAKLQDEVTQATTYGYNNTTGNRFVDATSKHIFMTNAVLNNVVGGKTDPTQEPAQHILAPVNKSYIYETEAAANNGVPATDIYVERGVAKVTLTCTDAIPTTTISAKSTATVNPGFQGWCLGKTNSRSYIVRKVPAYEDGIFKWNYYNVSTTSQEKYRFVGQNPVDIEYGGSAAGFRTYWALDPNYSADASAELLNPSDLDAELLANKDKRGDANPLYCYENTFDVDRQSYNNTTTAIIKVAFNGGAEFYTVGPDRKTIYLASDVTTLIANVLMAQSKFTTWLSAQPNLKKTTVVNSDLVIDWSSNNAGVVTVTDITIKNTVLGEDTKISTTTISSLLTTVNAQVSNIQRYANGIAYYPIRIKHFGDDLTPWENIAVGGVKPAESTIDKIYPGSGDVRNAAYLGRYGVVRNNWYVINVTGVTKIGLATPSEVLVPTTDHPDDELEDNFIKARINVLSWAKRVQNWNLK